MENVELKHQFGRAYDKTAFKSTKWLMVHGLFSGIKFPHFGKTVTLDDRFTLAPRRTYSEPTEFKTTAIRSIFICFIQAL